ncbi:MAG: peptidyl-prolyl cis-trans isomerase [Opitutae bacterium]|nr:peptidyl-prolyl cis-trans isomerase [Opitutae bacterium]
MKTPTPKIFLDCAAKLAGATAMFVAALCGAFAQETATPAGNSSDKTGTDNYAAARNLASLGTREVLEKMTPEERRALDFRLGMRDYIKADVNGEIILLEDLRRETSRGMLILQREAKSSEEYMQRQEQLILDTMKRYTEMYLLVGEFKENSAAMAQLSDEYVKPQIDSIVARDFDGDRSKYLAYLQASGSNPEREMERLKNSIIEQNQNWMISQKVPLEVSPMDVYRAYQQNIDQYRTSARVEFAQIVIYAGAAQSDDYVARAAKNLAERLRSSTDPDAFADAAKVYSRDEFRTNGGYVGWRTFDDLSAPVIEKINSVRPGETTDVLELVDGSNRRMFAIFKVLDKREAGVIPLDDVREQIENALRANAMTRARDEKLEELRQRFFVQWF